MSRGYCSWIEEVPDCPILPAALHLCARVVVTLTASVFGSLF
jgi:hypothetical protein